MDMMRFVIRGCMREGYFMDMKILHVTAILADVSNEIGIFEEQDVFYPILVNVNMES